MRVDAVAKLIPNLRAEARRIALVDGPLALRQRLFRVIRLF
jgi:hypothetical protein